MKMSPFAFTLINRADIEKTEHSSKQGCAYWQTGYFGEKQDPIRVRMVEYTPGYLADHWYKKGHILFCLKGELKTTLEDGRVFILKPGMSYQVGDNSEAHQSYTKTGVLIYR